MQMSKRVRGSISVLLTMILLPMATYAMMIIDASRLQLVRNNIAGAGDLTLNAMMSEYNIMLEEMYGLFANTTSEEELYDALRAYFQQTIEGKFLPQMETKNGEIQDTIDKTLYRAMNPDMYTREDITDFLALQLQDFSVDPVVGSALANPNTMKRQIVEYMKYRGPVSLGTTILGKLDFLADSSAQVNACDQKVEYAQTLSDLHDPCMTTYDAITDQYNNGALLLNEILGEGLVGKKDKDATTNQLLVPTKNPVGALFQDAKKEYQYATAFALMNAQSPFARNEDDIDQSISIGNTVYQTCTVKSEDHEHHNYESYLEEEKENYTVDNSQHLVDSNGNKISVECESYDPKLDLDDRKEKYIFKDEYKHLEEEQVSELNKRIQANIDKLNALIDVAGGDCGYDNDDSRLVMHSGNVGVNIGYKDNNATAQRKAGEFDLYKVNYLDVDEGIEKQTINNVTYHYPNYKRMLLSGKDKKNNYYFNIRSFIDTAKTDNHQIKNDELTKNDVAYQFETQYANSLMALKAQQELVGPLKNGIQYVAAHQAKFGEIQDRYQEIWGQLKSQLLEKYVSDYNQKYKKKKDDLEAKRNKWISDLMDMANWEMLTEKVEGVDDEGEKVEIYDWKSDKFPTWHSKYKWVYSRLENEQYETYKARVEELIEAAERETGLLAFTYKSYEEKNIELEEVKGELKKIEEDENRSWEDEIKKGELEGKQAEIETEIKNFILARIKNILSSFEEPGEDYLDSAANLTTDEEIAVWENVLSLGVGNMDQINKLEKTSIAMGQIQNFLVNGKDGNGSYQQIINDYIDRLKCHNQDYFGRFEDIHVKLGSSEYMGVALTLREMKKGLETAETNLNSILDLVTNVIEPQQKNWKNSIESIESDSTRAAMTSDYNSMADQIDKQEIENMKKLVVKLKGQVELWIKTIDNCTYLGEKLVTIGSTDETIGTRLLHADNSVFYENVKASMKDHFHCNISTTDDTDDVVNNAYQSIIGKVAAENPVFSIPKYNDNQNPNKDNDTQKLNDLLKEDKDFTNGNWNDDIFKTIAEKFVNDTEKFCISTDFNSFTRYTVLDGIKDMVDGEMLGSATTDANKEDADLKGAKTKYQMKEAGTGELIDPNEAFMITLYTEAKAAKDAETIDSEEEKAGNETADDISEIAGQHIADSTSVDADPDSGEESEEPPASEDFGAILSEIQAYHDIKDEDEDKSGLDGDPGIEQGEIDKKKPSKSKGKGGLKTAQGIMAKFANLGDTLVNGVYLEEYFTEMFTCRTDNQRLNYLTKKEDADSLPVILLNGYGNQASRSAKQLNINTEWYGKEVEYLLWGNSDLNTNLAFTDGTIFAIRFALNAIYAFTAPEIIQFVNSVATAIAGWTVIGVPIVAAVLTIGIAIAESGYDLYLLHDGRDVPIYKDQSTFVCSPVNALKELITEVTDDVISTVINEAAETVEDKLDDAIDEATKAAAAKVGDFADAKIGDCADQLNSFVEEFGIDQMEAIKTAIRKQFFAPIQNQLIQICSLVDISEKYEQLDVIPVIRTSLEYAFVDIQNNIKNEINPGSIVYTVCMELLNDENRTKIIDEIMALLESELKKIGDPTASAASKLTEYLQRPINTASQSVQNFEQIINGVIDGYIEKTESLIGKINASIDSVKENIKAQITAHSEDAAKSMKSFMHEQIDAGTKQLTGLAIGVKGDIEDNLPNKEDIKVDAKKQDTGLASKVTLNYKEYCKILMLIMVYANQQNVLQRAGVLITANMRNPKPQEKVEFSLTEAHTLFSVNANVNMGTLFPWPVKDVMDEANPNSGIQLDWSKLGGNSVTINYCGVNGY